MAVVIKGSGSIEGSTGLEMGANGTTEIRGQVNVAVGSSVAGVSTATNFAPSDIPTSNRNLIINGAMNFHQRGGTTTNDNVYLLDRWHIYSNPSAKHTVSQDTETPVGFKYSMKWTSASAYTPSSGNYFYTGQRIEGHNWDKMEYGTANAKTCTISFWARSSITGTWSGIVKNNAQDRTYPWEYTISSADTWEYKTVTVPGCTDGTWLSGASAGAWIYFCIGSTTSGTTYLGSANSWQNTNLIGTTGSNSLVNTNGATLYITGVQVEEGSAATSFEHRNYADELARCQRYYIQYDRGGSTADDGLTSGLCNVVAGDGNDCFGFLQLPVCMRASPTLAYSDADHFQTTRVFANTTDIGGSLSIAYASAHPHQSIYLRTNTSPNPSFSVGDTFNVRMKNQTEAVISFSAEL